MTERKAPFLLKGKPNRADRSTFGHPQKRASDRRKKMSMFMRIEVSNVDPGAPNLLQLGLSLTLYLLFADRATKQSLYKI
jgi:hypothetical protein